MEIRSRFLNADCEVEKVYREGDHLYVEGVVKGLMPVRIGIDPIDAARIILRSLNLSTLAFWASVPGALLCGLAEELAGRVRAAAPCRAPG